MLRSTRFRPYLAHFSPIFSRFFPLFLRVFTALPRRPTVSAPHAAGGADGTALRSRLAPPLSCLSSIFTHLFSPFFSPFFPNHFLKNDCRINHSLTSGLIWTQGGGAERWRAGGGSFLACCPFDGTFPGSLFFVQLIGFGVVGRVMRDRDGRVAGCSVGGAGCGVERHHPFPSRPQPASTPLPAPHLPSSHPPHPLAQIDKKNAQKIGKQSAKNPGGR